MPMRKLIDPLSPLGVLTDYKIKIFRNYGVEWVEPRRGFLKRLSSNGWIEIMPQ